MVGQEADALLVYSGNNRRGTKGLPGNGRTPGRCVARRKPLLVAESNRGKDYSTVDATPSRLTQTGCGGNMTQDPSIASPRLTRFFVVRVQVCQSLATEAIRRKSLLVPKHQSSRPA